ncbi:hypothetical protein ABBQ32_000177 [Trebouxia sp. C0010 RCD-2024]
MHCHEGSLDTELIHHSCTDVRPPSQAFQPRCPRRRTYETLLSCQGQSGSGVVPIPAMASAAAKYAELRAETSSAFDHLGLFLADLCEGSEAHQDSSSQQGPSLDTSLGSFYETFTALQARHADQNLTVAVLALTKSGKSTLLNALIGASCLPANNVPETARITRISHTAGQAELVDNTSGQSRTVTGEKDIKTYLQYLNSEVRMRDHQLSDETYLDLNIPIAALKAYDHDESRAHDVTIRLLDTPGPNEAGEIALKAQVERLLDSVDAVIYLLDYTKLKTADEAEVLQRLKEINPQLMARLSQRLFFVVNKADMIETSEGLDAEATKQYVAELITQQMKDESFQLKPEQVLLVSAQHALLSRLVLQGNSDKDLALRFGRLAFGSRARSFPPHEYKAAAQEMLADSGLAELEQTVLAFLYAHSGSLKLLALLDDIVRMLQQIKNVAAASNAALQHDVAFLQRETLELQSKLERSLQSFDTIQQEAQAVEGEVIDEVQQRMQHLKEKLFCDVTNVLEPRRQHPPGRWQEAWHRAARFLNRRPGHSEAHQLELQNKLYELHAAISSSIEAEVRDFWQDVEAATNERQRAMFQCINRRLESLSRQIEATVGEALNLRLEPVTIAMDPPAAQDFHESLQNLFAQGIRQRSVTRNRRRQQAYTVWEPRFRNGLCRTGQYFVGRPEHRHVTEQYEQPVYELQPQHIKEYFIALVDGTIEASVKYVREYVHAYLSDMLEEAKSQIQTYGQSFSAAMQAALATRQQGEDARSAALQVTITRLTSTNTLLRNVAAIQRHAEQLCPGQHPISDVMSEFSLDEPESSHAVHAEAGSNHAESSHVASGAIDTGSELEKTSKLVQPSSDNTDGWAEYAGPTGSKLLQPSPHNTNGWREYASPTEWSNAPPAAPVLERLQRPTYGLPQPLASTSGDAAHGQPVPGEQDLWEAPLPAELEGLRDAPVPAKQQGWWDAPVPDALEGLWGAPAPAEQKGLWDAPVPADREGLWDAPAPVEQEGSWALPAQAEQEDAWASPVLPTAASMGSDRVAESPLPAMMSELQQAMSASMSSAGSAHEPLEGMLLDEQTQLELALFLSLQDNQLPQAQPSAAPLEATEEALSESEPESVKLGSMDSDSDCDSEDSDSEAESAAIAAATHGVSAAARAEAAANAAVNHAESAATSAVAQAESAATAAAAQAESAATAAAAHATAAANTVAAHVEAAARSVDAALNQQAASVRGTAARLSNWLTLRPRSQPQSNPPASSGQGMARPQSEVLSVHDSDSAQQEEAELAEAAKQIHSDDQGSPHGLPRRHSASSDDSSFDLTEPPAAATPSVPVDQFAALSLLDFDSVMPQDHNDDDSPFDVHSEDQDEAGSSHISHADGALTDAGLAVPVIPWDPTDSDEELHHDAHGVQDEAPVHYPQIHSPTFSASSSDSESPVHYPQVHMPVSQHPDAGHSLQARQPASSETNLAESPSPRTQMHMTALGSGAVSWQSSASDEHEGIGRLAALGGHAEMSHDSDEWELVSSEVDEEL